jgi:chemotaxis family two-component system response regulator Rcp1
MVIMENACSKKIEILYVEDDEDNVLILKRCLKTGKVCNDLHVVSDGDEAIEFLQRSTRYKDAHRPDLILLDWNLPKKSGQEVLARIKADPDLKTIPVIVFSSSAADKDIIEAYSLHANSFITKPVDFDKFSRAIRSMQEFWFEIVKLPPATSPNVPNSP